MKYAVWIAVVALLILHQDNWFWEDDTLVFGFLPIGLFWHMGISLVASFVWFLATVFAWPKQLEFAAEDTDA